MSTTADRVHYAQVRQYDVPSSLCDLHGPSSGTLDLPRSVHWGPRSAFDLDKEADLARAYNAIIREGRLSDQRRLLNPRLLLRVWPLLTLPRECARRWEECFASLADERQRHESEQTDWWLEWR
ncbi:MAG: hypothetical protein QM621_12700 [Aeromicrobium sp.]|uniref:hypothetical protein n=1 Tax=Aeromicrobium sp. TaxID=1871063 RepID=UPI0039E530EF